MLKIFETKASFCFILISSDPKDVEQPKYLDLPPPSYEEYLASLTMQPVITQQPSTYSTLILL